jgi:hypothetical protein
MMCSQTLFQFTVLGRGVTVYRTGLTRWGMEYELGFIGAAIVTGRIAWCLRWGAP